MLKKANQFIHLESSFPGIISQIKLYMGMDRDFEQLCHDFEEVVDNINILEHPKVYKTKSIQSKIKYLKRLKDELKADIECFI